MKKLAIIALLLLAGCGNRQTAEDATMLVQARELVVLTAQQAFIREKLVDELSKAPEVTMEDREQAARELITARSELEQLQKWTAEFAHVIETQDNKKLELKRISFPRVVGRLRKSK